MLVFPDDVKSWRKVRSTGRGISINLNLPWIMPGLNRTREVKMLWSNIILSELTCNLDRSILCLLTGGRLEWPSSKVKKLHTKSTPQPLSKKTPKGGRKMAQMIFLWRQKISQGVNRKEEARTLQMSEAVKGMRGGGTKESMERVFI